MRSYSSYGDNTKKVENHMELAALFIIYIAGLFYLFQSTAIIYIAFNFIYLAILCFGAYHLASLIPDSDIEEWWWKALLLLMAIKLWSTEYRSSKGIVLANGNNKALVKLLKHNELDVPLDNHISASILENSFLIAIANNSDEGFIDEAIAWGSRNKKSSVKLTEEEIEAKIEEWRNGYSGREIIGIIILFWFPVYAIYYAISH